ncbi:tetratricopeptide repeat protein, partial [Teredinibacter turnerae]|uniref:tetratricopeptide repeat protein n=1 Tax=Teredinibacter turnerae TaxID=2426 RepID=UPI001F08645D
MNGMGGIGKTALAQSYIASTYDRYAHIAWVQQSSENFKQDLISTPGLLQALNVSPEGDIDSLFTQIIQAMCSLHQKPNLLVIDDASNSLAKIRDSLPRQPHWHLLVTSRQEIAGFEPKHLGFLTETSAVNLFKRHYQRTDLSDSDVKFLVRLVDYHTLTIELLAKVAHRQRTSLVKIQHAIENDLQANVYIDHQQQGEKVERIRSYLCSIFTTEGLSENEIQLLKLLVCLPAEFHSFFTIEALISSDTGIPADSLSDLLESLRESGWLIFSDSDNSYKMHQVIQRVLQYKLNVLIDDASPLLESLTGKLSIDQTKDNPVDKFQWVPFGKRFLELFELQHSLELSRLQNNLALVLQDLWDYEGAKALLEKALAS